MNGDAAGMLGILNRGKAIAFGPDMEKRLRKGSLLLLASDASERTKRELRAKAASLHLEIIEVGSKEELGAPLGRPELSAALILSKKGAESLKKKLQKGETT